ncbi:MAG: outer membrane beta-barrel protein [Chitinophagales bacterium]
MKKITLLLVSLSVGLLTVHTAKAQAFEEGNSYISVGYGFPNLLGSIFKAYEEYNDYHASSTGPIYGKYEYAINDHIGVGALVNYSSTKVTYQYDSFDDNGDPAVYGYEVKWSSFSILGRVNWHFGESDKFDPYFGVGMGYRSSSYTVTSDDPYLDNWEIGTLIPFGMEITVGGRYFFTDAIGVYAELGFAKSPFQVGLTAKF